MTGTATRAGRTGGHGRDPVRRVAFDVLRAVRRARRLRQPRAARACCASAARRPRRGVRDRAGLRHAARRGHLRRGARRPASTGRWTASTRRCSTLLRLGAHQLLGMRVPDHAAVAATVDLVRAVVGRGARPRSSTPSCAGSRAQDLTAWLAQVAPDRDADPIGHLAVATSTRAGSSRRCATRSAVARRRRPRRCCAPTTSRPRSRSSPGRAGPTSTSCWPRRRARALVAVRRRASPAATRPSCRRSASGACRRPGRGQPAGRARAGRGAARRRRRPALARPVRRPGRQGRPARRGSRRARRARSLAAELQPHRADLVAGALRRSTRAGAPGRRRRRTRGTVAARDASTGCSSTSRAPGWVRCAAGPRRAGGARPPTWPTLGAAAARAAGRGAGRGPARRRGRLRDLLAAPRRDRVRGRATCCRGRADVEPCSTPGRACPSVDRARRRASGPAVAAPARHRRDVHRAAAPDG